MSFEDDILAIYDSDEPGTLVVLAPAEGYEIDEVDSMTVVIAKSNGDGVILTVQFRGDMVTASMRAYADSRPGPGWAGSAAHRP